MVNEFLQKVDLDALVKETGLALDEIAELSGIAEARNLKKWTHLKEKGGSRPSYNAMVRLVMAGASVKTLLGVEAKAEVKVVEKPITEEQFLLGVKKALADLGKDV